MESPLLRLLILSHPLTNMATTDILVSDWLISKNSPLKSLSQMNRNLVGSIYGSFAIQIAHYAYQFSVHLAKRFQRRRLFLEINQLETRIVCGGHVC
jgi:hypothetical protein